VLRRGERAKTYGTLLIDIAAQCGGHRVGAVALADRTSHLERRILAMTPRTSRFTRARAIGLAAVAGLAVITACEARLPTSAEVEAMDVASAEKALVNSKIMLDEKTAANVVYVVNDQKVSAEQAHAIPANRIAAMNVYKGDRNAEGSGAKVYITTTDHVAQGSPMKVFVHNGQPAVITPDGMLKRKSEFAGLLYIDGVLAPSNTLEKIKRDDIVSVNILKNDEARAVSSDPAAANGIIKVVTKAAAAKAAP